MARLFGTDGIRGIANKELTPELAFRLGRAAAHFFGREEKHPRFFIGRDTRISGQLLESSLCSGICSSGGEAVVLGVIPTPGVAYLTKKLGGQAGVVISASHNPYADNGIKFFAGSGYKLPDAVEGELEDIILTGMETLPRPTGASVGTISYRQDLAMEYVDYLCETVSGDFSNINVVVDCANGASFEAAPEVFNRLGFNLTLLCDRPNGVNINQHCGSTHMEGLSKAVLSRKADLGIAFDGDADRCLAVDENGQIVDGDQIMLILALNLLNLASLKDKTLVTTVMSNLGLHRAIKQAGGKALVTGVGDRYVLEAMLKQDLSLGGEQSGHIIFNEYSTTGDGLLTALQLISAIRATGKKLSELAAMMTRFPQVLLNVKVRSKEGWEKNVVLQRAIAMAEAELGEEGRILVRASGTEQLIRVMAEGPSLADLERLAGRLVEVVEAEFN